MSVCVLPEMASSVAHIHGQHPFDKRLSARVADVGCAISVETQTCVLSPEVTISQVSLHASADSWAAGMIVLVLTAGMCPTCLEWSEEDHGQVVFLAQSLVPSTPSTTTQAETSTVLRAATYLGHRVALAPVLGA